MLSQSEAQNAITTLKFLTLARRDYALYGTGQVGSQIMDLVKKQAFRAPLFAIDSKYTYSASFMGIPLVPPNDIKNMPPVAEILLATNAFVPQMRAELKARGIDKEPLTLLATAAPEGPIYKGLKGSVAFRHGVELRVAINKFTDAKHEYALYGAGKFCVSVMNEIVTGKLRAPKLIVDDKPSRAEIMGTPVVAPDKIKDIDEIIIASSSKVDAIKKRVADLFKGRIKPVVLGQSPHGFVYDDIRLPSRYSPWNSEPDFVAAYKAIANHTLVDKYRGYELWRLAEETAKLESGAVIEIGVWRGGTAVLMAMKARQRGVKDRIYFCDTFTGVVKVGDEDPYYRGGEHGDTSLEIVKKLASANLPSMENVFLLKGIFPDETADQVAPGEKFRLCHVDVDIYESAKAVVAWIWDRMVPGGIIVFDDYGWKTTPGVTLFVNEQRGLTDRHVLYNLNGHAILLKAGGRGA